MKKFKPKIGNTIETSYNLYNKKLSLYKKLPRKLKKELKKNQIINLYRVVNITKSSNLHTITLKSNK